MTFRKQIISRNTRLSSRRKYLVQGAEKTQFTVGRDGRVIRLGWISAIIASIFGAGEVVEEILEEE